MGGTKSKFFSFENRFARCRLAAILLAAALAVPVAARTADAPLSLEAIIPLGDVGGRIDHLAVDVQRRRLYVAELGNDSLGVVDLAAGKLDRTVAGLRAPQGVGAEPTTDSVYVANAGDGSVRIFGGGDLSPIGRVELGDDADNVRIDAARQRVLVGYGSGGLAVIDPASRSKVADIKLKAHPEGFQIGGAQVFINLPDARLIAIADLTHNTADRTFSTAGNRQNFPMAIDLAAQRILTVFRSPARLAAFATDSGQPVASGKCCGDADDVFIDPKRHRVYLSCGAGVVEVFAEEAGVYRRIAQIPTASGARTSLFVAEMDRLYVALRASAQGPAAIWVFRPTP
jgi:DNA-binding beta-propeller fold protein YncE